MFNDRDILESQKVVDSQTLLDVNVSEQITNLMKNKNYQEVISKCLKMTMSKKKYAVMAYAYLGLKQWKNLIETCDRGLQYDKKQPQFYSLKAKAMGKLGKHHEKILLLTDAIRLDPSIPSYHRNLGSAYYSIQKYELAAQQYSKAIELQPSNVLNYHNKGSAFFKNQQYQQAKECFKKALQFNPNLALSYSWLADCQKQLQNFEQAEKHYKKAYQMSGKQVYHEQINKMEKQKNLHKHKGSWMYGLAWLGSKVL